MDFKIIISTILILSVIDLARGRLCTKKTEKKKVGAGGWELGQDWGKVDCGSAKCKAAMLEVDGWIYKSRGCDGSLPPYPIPASPTPAPAPSPGATPSPTLAPAPTILPEAPGAGAIPGECAAVDTSAGTKPLKEVIVDNLKAFWEKVKTFFGHGSVTKVQSFCCADTDETCGAGGLTVGVLTILVPLLIAKLIK